MISRALVLLFVFGGVGIALAQEEPATKPAADPQHAQPAPEKATDPTESTTEMMKERAQQLASDTEEEVKKIAKQVDQNPQAKKAAAGILEPIYILAEALSFSAFHWLAFMLMSAGVISYALQLLLGKLVVLMRMGFSVKEIASDAVGLAISVIGLVLTTQAATENSDFTGSPAAVISATAIGVILGLVLYLWGQRQELEAVAGRTKMAAKANK